MLLVHALIEDLIILVVRLIILRVQRRLCTEARALTRIDSVRLNFHCKRLAKIYIYFIYDSLIIIFIIFI